jgi:hypothetical protein
VSDRKAFSMTRVSEVIFNIEINSAQKANQYLGQEQILNHEPCGLKQTCLDGEEGKLLVSIGLAYHKLRGSFDWRIEGSVPKRSWKKALAST